MAREFRKREIAPKESLGELLSKRRLFLKLEVSDLASELKIRREYLTALEKNDYDALPADVYVRGFVKSYAKKLGLNPERAEAIYRRERSIDMNVRGGGAKLAVDKMKTPKILLTPKTLAGLSFATATGLLGVYLLVQFVAFLRPPALALSSPKSQESSIGEADSVFVEGKTDPGAELYINDFQVRVTEGGGFGETLVLKEGLNVVEVKAVSKLNKVRTLIYKVFTNAKPKVALRPDEAPQVVDGVELTIWVTDKRSWIEVWQDGNAAFGGTGSIFEPGAKKKFTAKSSIKLKVGNAAAVTVTVTNKTIAEKSIGPLGKLGEVLTLEFRSDQTF